jgi:hypothetical protein
MMVPIPEGLRLELSAKYTMPSTFSLKSSKSLFRMSCERLRLCQEAMHLSKEYMKC